MNLFQAGPGENPSRPASRAAADSGPATRPVVFFDGNCELCRGLVGLAGRAARSGRVQFEPLHGDMARLLLQKRHFAEDTLWLKQGEHFYGCSSAVLRLMWLLGWPWNLAAPLLLVPRPLRDAVYRAVARRRNWVSTR